MSALLDMLVPALVLSGLALVGLALLPKAPPRVRFLIALAGLAAWAVPWPLIELPVQVPGAAVMDRLADTVVDRTAAAAQSAGYAPTGSASASAPASAEHLGPAIVALFLVGLVRFIADWLALRASLRNWRARSRSGEGLRALLPGELRRTRAAIRIVPGSRVAAATGWIRPTIWIGDGFANEARLRLALMHECWHLRRFDPLSLALITAMRRAYWWNPLVACLSRQAVVMMESACDRRCADALGKRQYVEHVAAMMLESAGCSAPRLAPAARSLDVLRLRLLDDNVYLRVRDRLLIVFLSAAGILFAASRLDAVPAPKPERSRVAIPATPAGTALSSLLEASNNGDMELLAAYLGAYTPQEVPWHLHRGTDGVELLAIVNSERLSIEYLVQPNRGEGRRIGRLEVADTASVRVKSSTLRTVPPASPQGERRVRR